MDNVTTERTVLREWIVSLPCFLMHVHQHISAQQLRLHRSSAPLERTVTSLDKIPWTIAFPRQQGITVLKDH